MMLIDKQAAIDAINAVFPVDPNKSEYASGIACGAALALTYIKQLPPAQPESDKEKISDLLRRLYLIQSAHLTKEVIGRKQHYCEELWKALFHDDEFPVWMHWS